MATHGTCISKKVFLTTSLGPRAAASCSSNFQAFDSVGTKRAITSSCLGHGWDDSNVQLAKPGYKQIEPYGDHV